MPEALLQQGGFLHYPLLIAWQVSWGKKPITSLPNYWLQLQVRRVLGFLLQWDVGTGEEGAAALADCGGYPDWLLLQSSLCKLVCEPSRVAGACLTVLGSEQRPETLAPSCVLRIPLEAFKPAGSFP